ncbi:MAG: hypothetical protein ACRD4P_15940 [Bryobacteraceae bacterium]
MRAKLLVAATLIAVMALPMVAKKTGFDGKWVIDKQSPSAHDPDFPIGLTQRIKHNGSGFTIESQFPEPKSGVVPLLYLGIMATRLSLSADGSQSQNQIGPFQQAAKTTVDGNSMTTEWVAVVKGDQVQGKWVRTLSDDGKHMTLEVNETSNGQTRQATIIFKRA